MRAAERVIGRRLGVTQTTAWTVKHKLKQVMMERDAKKRLIGRVEIDVHVRPEPGESENGKELNSATEPQFAPSEMPLEDAIAEIMSSVPPEDWATLPEDLSDNLDHYLYGTPRDEKGVR